MNQTAKKPASNAYAVANGQDPRQMAAGDDMAADTQASPEEQAVYSAVIKAAMGAATKDSETFDAMMETLGASGELPAQNVARLVVTLIGQAEKETGQQLDDDMLESAAEELIATLYELAENDGAIQEQAITDELLAQTYMEFLMQWAQVHPDRLDEEDMAALQEMQAQGGQQTQQPQKQGGLIAQAGAMPAQPQGGA